MRRWIAIAGVIVLLVGIAIVLNSNVPTKKNNKVQVKQVEGEWNISDNFEKGQNLSLDFLPAADWRLPMYFPEEDLPYTKTFQVNVTNVVANSYTVFEVIIGPPIGITPSAPYAFELYVYRIKLVHDGAITAENEPRDNVGGRIENDGLYEVRTSLIPSEVIDRDLNGNLWHHEASPPSQLVLYKTTTETTYPNTYLLPIGASLGIVGAIMSIWGFRSRKRRIARKR